MNMEKKSIAIIWKYILKYSSRIFNKSFVGSLYNPIYMYPLGLPTITRNQLIQGNWNVTFRPHKDFALGQNEIAIENASPAKGERKKRKKITYLIRSS